LSTPKERAHVDTSAADAEQLRTRKDDSPPKFITFVDPKTGTTRKTQKVKLSPEALSRLRDEFGADLVRGELGDADDHLLAKGEAKKDYEAYMRKWLRRSLDYPYPKPGGNGRAPGARQLTITERNHAFFNAEDHEQRRDEAAIEVGHEHLADVGSD
jgi:hypothetical protein